MTMISGLSEPLGAVLAYVFLAKYINDFLLAILLIIVAGLMITLAIEKMFPEVKKYNYNKQIFLGLIMGVIISLLSIFL